MVDSGVTEGRAALEALNRTRAVGDMVGGRKRNCLEPKKRENKEGGVSMCVMLCRCRGSSERALFETLSVR